MVEKLSFVIFRILSFFDFLFFKITKSILRFYKLSKQIIFFISTIQLRIKNSINSDRMNLYCTLQEKIIPCLEFTMEFQSNQLIYQKEYTKQQQIIYVLIQHLHDREGWGYRKISQWLNQSSILTYTGKKWFSSFVISVLKRKHERDLMNEQIRNQHFPSKISKFEVNYYFY